MESCVVCLDANVDTFSRITTDSNEWKDGNIQCIVEKHLSWWYLRSTSDFVQWICQQCWQEISTFHSFYLRVEKEHQHCELVMPIVKIDVDEGEEVNLSDMLAVVKEECNVIDNESTPDEDLIPLAKRLKIKKKKITKIPKEADEDTVPVLKRRRRSKKKTVPETAVNKNEELLVNVKSENDLDLVDNADALKEELDDIEPSIDSLDDVWEPDNYDNSCDEDEDKNGIATDEEDVKIKPTKSKTTPKTEKRKRIRKRKESTGGRKPKTFESEETIKEYDEFLTENKFEFACQLCTDKQTTFQNLKNHYRKDHKIIGYAMCCNRKYYQQRLLVDHIHSHNDPNIFKCQHCHKVLASRASLQNHLDLHQEPSNSDKRNYTCDKCNKSFIKKNVYERHLLIHIPEEEKKFPCDQCEKRFPTEEFRKRHITLAHLKKYCKICDICGKLLHNKITFADHMKEHNGAVNTKMACDICGALLSNKYKLNKHKKLNHTAEFAQPQICPYCSKVSPNVMAHRHHVRDTHLAEYKHACHMCDKKFKRPKHLREHLSTHTGEPLYTCHFCPETFISSANKYKHLNHFHHKEWEEEKIKQMPALHLRALKNSEQMNPNNSQSLAPTLQSYPESLIAALPSGSIANFNVVNFLK